MIATLSTGHEIGLAIVGVSFISFALLSSFVFPKLKPDFPGPNGLRWYLPLAACFFVAMLAAVLVFGKEEKDKATAAPPSTSTTSAPGSTASAAPSAPYAGGSATAGKAVFTSAGCSACHTFAAAASTGKIGPDLDHMADYAKKAGAPLGDYTVDSIIKPPAKYVPPGFPTNQMPNTFGTSLTKQQIADLVAFVDGSS